MLMRLPYGIFRNLTLLSNIWTYKPPTQIVCWPAPPPSQLLIQGYSSNLCAPDGSATYGTAVSNGYLALSCPAKSFISGVTFASFGTPVGVSGRYQLGTCAFNSTVAAVSSACIKHQSCLLMASTTAFGPNQCPSTPQSSLSLSVAVNCTSNATTKRTAAARNTFNLRTVPSHKSSVSYGQRQLKVLSTQGRTLLTTLRTTVSAPRATTRHSQRGTVLATLRPTVPTPLSTTRHLTGSRSDEMQSGTQDISGTATGRSNISGPFILIACTVTVSIVGIASLIQLWRLKQQPDSSGAAQRQAPSSVMLPTSAKLFSSPGQARASNTEFPSGTASVYSYFYPSNRR
ncbi:hypothetical protein PBRA_009094 [Plasmodiophora brassicae]|uniref:SUEL-type lectin domain-containing protein n=1 Tax=Plasmodiophora brassicae TaxID=37360 RepID=A0A0G4J4K6_PLABS|nr:hypothetical protein PBRA_009094 [Plasmodiophora brassicae]